MTQRVNPSSPAGEGGPRRTRGRGEGARSLVGAARKWRATMTAAERKLWLALKDRRFGTAAVVPALNLFWVF
jgi:hypothetical protein